MSGGPQQPAPQHDAHSWLNGIVAAFLNSHLSLILIILAAALLVAMLWVTPREEEPQIVVPLADVYVDFPGRSAAEVEQLVATPLERLLYQIDGVEYVYSMSREGQAIITVRFYVGEDRERSLVRLYKRIDEHLELVPEGVTGWVIKPVEIDDVPIVTLTLRGGGDGYGQRRVAEELVARLAATPQVSRAYVVGGLPRRAHVYLDPQRMQAYSVSPLMVQRALGASNVARDAGSFARGDADVVVEVGPLLGDVRALREVVVGVFGDRPVFLKDVAEIRDGAGEPTAYVRHRWGAARGFDEEAAGTGKLVGAAAAPEPPDAAPAVTIAIAKQKGSNAVWVARDVLAAAETLRAELVPADMELVITRNYGLTANHKVNELVEALAVAVFIVIALLTLGLGWREALIVAVAVPVVFGLTLLVNWAFGYTINRVTLFALILSLGLLVDDPIVDVENISRHFALHKRATRHIVLEAVAEIRPPLITATLAVIVSFLPMFYITGMMGPYMRPMALNVPVAMVMSMVVAFTITPWLSYHLLKRRYTSGGAAPEWAHETDDLAAVRSSALYKLFYPLMAPLLRSRRNAWLFVGVIGLLTLGAVGLAAVRAVPLKMLPFDNKTELLLVVDLPEGTTLERTDACARALAEFVAAQPEVTDVTTYVGLASPMDFNGLVRHYYLRQGPAVAELRLNLVDKKSRRLQSHALGLRMRDELTAIAAAHDATLKLVELPPGPPVLSTLVAEVTGQPGQPYGELQAAARVVAARMEREPGVVDIDTTIEAAERKLTFAVDQEKAALAGVSVEQIAQTVRAVLHGASGGLLADPHERNPLTIWLRVPRAERSSAVDLARIHVVGEKGNLVPLAELGAWRSSAVEQTIYHKNLQPIVYVEAEAAGRPPADCIVDMQADRVWGGAPPTEARVISGPSGPAGWVAEAEARPVEARTFLSNGGGVAWATAPAIDVAFAGEGEWKITLDVFRDLGLAFAAALVGIYVLLVAQTGSFVIPLVVMLAIPLTALGIMPGFWLLNLLSGGTMGGYGDPVLFTATGMIGMIALAGIVTRDSIILVDFIHLSLRRGRNLFDAIMESRVVRLRPILLTAGTAMLSAAPITIDPIFSGLAWALIFGLLASTVFTLFVIPVSYWLLYERTPGHGLPTEEAA